MSRILVWVAVVVCSALAGSGVVALGVARQTFAQAETTRDGAIRLREARLDLIEAQNALGRSDLESAVQGAEKTNETALRVQANTSRLLEQLRGLAADVDDVTATSASSAETLDVTRGRMRTAASLLRAVRREQQTASDATTYTTRFLRRILAALRETNRSLP